MLGDSLDIGHREAVRDSPWVKIIEVFQVGLINACYAGVVTDCHSFDTTRVLYHIKEIQHARG